MMEKKLLAIFTTAMIFLGAASHVTAQERAKAEVKNASGKTVGTADFRETKDGVLLTMRLDSLPPGLHAVHIHAVGKCEAPGFTSAGGHFNPLGTKHGLKNP